MLNVTDLNAIREVAKKMLNTPPVQDDKYPGIYHPFYGFLTTAGEIPMRKKFFTEKIENARTYLGICTHVNKPYLPRFFALSNEYLSSEDFSKGLAFVWERVEYPNISEDVTVFRFMHYFKSADKSFLMNEDERKGFDKLPDEITIYRGYNQYGRLEALSWTVDRKQAEWFARRFRGNAFIAQATIKKEHVFAYFTRESEVIVNFKKLENVKISILKPDK